ncbi:MAG TPA: hypothetical protein VM345_07590 [Acidimicrobiales bacterium]|jgi:hypothetical protein|nr:hypothetical protein [Acidimicrobiales bacterium]
MSRLKEALAPKPRPLADYLEANAFVGGIVQLIVAVLIGALATSRAEAHALTPWTLAAVVAAAAAGGVAVGWPIAVYGGAADTLKGLVVVDAPPGAAPEGDDELHPRTLWARTAGWAAGAAAWSFSAAALVAVVLDGRHANALVVIAALAALGGVSGRAVDLLARRRGVELARRSMDAAPASVPARRRAWLHIALPVAIGQGLVNAGIAWLLFHEYVQGDPFAERALTEEAVVAEVATIVVLLVAVFAPMVRSWGEVDARLGRVELDEPASAPVGPQAFVYLIVAAFVLGPMAGLLLPATPSLLRVIVVRSLLAFAVVFVIAGLAHVRGAINATYAATAVPVAPRSTPEAQAAAVVA